MRPSSGVIYSRSSIPGPTVPRSEVIRKCASKTLLKCSCSVPSLHIPPEAHVGDETASDIRTYVACARTNRKKIHILHSSSGCLHTIHDRAATCSDGTRQITLIHLIRALLAMWRASEEKVTVFNVAVQEDLPNAFALVASSVEALLLREPDRRIGRSNSENPRIVHGFLLTSAEPRVDTLGHVASSCASN